MDGDNSAAGRNTHKAQLERSGSRGRAGSDRVYVYVFSGMTSNCGPSERSQEKGEMTFLQRERGIIVCINVFG